MQHALSLFLRDEEIKFPRKCLHRNDPKRKKKKTEIVIYFYFLNGKLNQKLSLMMII